jgi:hypothetical protein
MRISPRIAVGALALAIVSVAALAAPAQAQLTLQNDGFTSGAQVGVQQGFVAGEIAASRFVAPDAGRRLLEVQLFFGGATGSRDVTIKVWDDTSGALAPGAMLFEGDFTLTASDSNLSSIDLSGSNITVPAQFRVGIEFQHRGTPSVARDGDGTYMPNRNFIYADIGQWLQSSTFGVTGDWIIRAVVSNATGTPDAGVLPDAATGSPDAATGSPDAATGGPDAGVAACTGNAQCPVGQYCDTAVGSCTFDCRTADDCGGGTCNSLGQCLAPTDEGGCCSTGTPGGALGALGLGAAVALMLGRRRRR